VTSDPLGRLKTLVGALYRLNERARVLAEDGESAARLAPAIDRAIRFLVLALGALEEGAPREGTGPRLARRAGALQSGSFSGASEVISIPTLLSFLKGQRKTGLLRVALGIETIHIHLKDGDVAHAFCDNAPSGSRLGEILVEQGMLDQWLLDQLIAEHGAAGPGAGHLPLERLVTQEQLRAAREVQVQRLFHRLFEADDARFHFQEGDFVVAANGTLLNVIQLLLESARRCDESREGTQTHELLALKPLTEQELCEGWLLGGGGEGDPWDEATLGDAAA
jgi:hypothetical protein